MLSDSGIIKILYEVIDSNTRASADQIEKIKKIDAQNFENEVIKCAHLNNDIFE